MWSPRIDVQRAALYLFVVIQSTLNCSFFGPRCNAQRFTRCRDFENLLFSSRIPFYLPKTVSALYKREQDIWVSGYCLTQPYIIRGTACMSNLDGARWEICDDFLTTASVEEAYLVRITRIGSPLCSAREIWRNACFILPGYYRLIFFQHNSAYLRLICVGFLELLEVNDCWHVLCAVLLDDVFVGVALGLFFPHIWK